jgi:hypothetical protein
LVLADPGRRLPIIGVVMLKSLIAIVHVQDNDLGADNKKEDSVKRASARESFSFG